MEYIYAALLLHKAGKEITATNLNKVIESAGGKVDEAKAKVVAESLKDVNIDEAIKQATIAPVSAAPVAATGEAKEGKKEEKEEKKSEEAAAQGLASLFG